MWIAVATVLVFNILHMLSIDYGAARIYYALTWLPAGQFIGFAEEVLTRGFVVRIMRSCSQCSRRRLDVRRPGCAAALGQPAARATASCN